MTDDVLTNKASTIERCLQRVREEYADDPRNLRDNITRQDAIILNVQRACQAAIDLAMHLVRIHALGPPQESRDAFALLIEADLLPKELGQQLMRMVGFRNIAIHDYQELNVDIVQSIIENQLTDFSAFTELVLSTNGFRETP